MLNHLVILFFLFAWIFLSIGLWADFQLDKLSFDSIFASVEDSSSGRQLESSLSLESVSVETLNFSEVLSEEGLSIKEKVDVESNESVFVGPLLNYPNPFSFSRDTTVIGYRLSGNMDIELRIYSMTGQLIVQKKYYVLDQDPETRSGYCTISVDDNLLEGRTLSPGIYFYVLINNGDVLAKEKMAVLP